MIPSGISTSSSSRKASGSFDHIFSQLINDVGNSALSQSASHAKASFVLFSAFLLENDHLVSVADRLNYGFNSGSSDEGTPHNSVAIGADQRDLFEYNLPSAKPYFFIDCVLGLIV